MAPNPVRPRAPRSWVFLVLLAASCRPQVGPKDDPPRVDDDTADTSEPVDADGDGWPVLEDCDDQDAGVNPGAAEDCATAADDDCDGSTDAQDAANCTTWYADLDGDGYGDRQEPACRCAPPSGSVADNSDCDDADPSLNPDSGGCVRSLATAEVRFLGNWVGRKVAGPGDMDQDGLDDLLVAGTEAYLVARPSPGTATLSADHEWVMAVLTGPFQSATGAGDGDGDGWRDVVSGYDLDGTGGDEAGSVRFARGPFSGTISASDADATLFGEEAWGNAGSSVAGGFDTNADGRDDFLVGAPDYAGRGTAYLVLGPASGERGLSSADAQFVGEPEANVGISLNQAGDTDADGRADIVIGASDSGSDEDVGAAYLVLGGASGMQYLADGEAVFAGESEGDMAGISVGGGGDVDADGYDDVLVGALRHSAGVQYGGAAYLVRGPASGARSLRDADAKILGDLEDAYVGAAVSVAGDVDADGLADVLIAAPGSDLAGLAQGAAHLFRGPLRGTLSVSSADRTLVGECHNCGAGSPLAGAGDADGDGRDDLLIAAPSDYDGGTIPGAAFLLFGSGL